MSIHGKHAYLFSDRYSEILKDKDFATEFSFEMSSALNDVLFRFDEPTRVKRNRYDDWLENTCTSREVYTRYFSKMGFPIDRIDDVDLEWLNKRSYYEWFDIIELWNEDLSAGEKSPFQEAINEVLSIFDQPWYLVQGHIIKIDSKQFEQDLALKTLDLLSLRVCNTPVFQNAFDEYVRAIELFDKHEYKDCVLYAEKSYESVLKIICNKTDGQADSLTRAFMGSDFIDDIPQQISKEGFRTNILTSLPYLRNQLKVGHGEGGENIPITHGLAKLVLNLSASLNSFIVEQYISHLPPSTAVSDEDDDLPF